MIMACQKQDIVLLSIIILIRTKKAIVSNLFNQNPWTPKLMVPQKWGGQTIVA
jgi:hypothetical protein